MSTRGVLSWAVLCLLVGGADAHGLQFLLAKVTPTEGGRVKMEISADFTANPLIADEKAAEAVIAGILMIHSQGGTRPVGKAPGIRFARTRDIDPTCPVQIPPAPGGLPHELLTGYLEEPVEGNSLELGIPKGNPHDVILWTMPVGGVGMAEKKYSLIAGDTVKLAMPARRSEAWKFWAVLSAAVVMLTLFTLAWRRRVRRSS